MLTNDKLNQHFEKANQFVSIKFGDVHLLDIMNLPGGATNLDSFLKAYKTEETKGFFPYKWFDNPEKLNNKNYLHTILSLANCVKLYRSEMITTTLKTSLLEVYLQSKQYASYD